MTAFYLGQILRESVALSSGKMGFVPRTQREPRRFFGGVVRCRAGAVTNAGAWYGPGSAKRHQECRIASGTRYCPAAALPRVRGSGAPSTPLGVTAMELAEVWPR